MITKDPYGIRGVSRPWAESGKTPRASSGKDTPDRLYCRQCDYYSGDYFAWACNYIDVVGKARSSICPGGTRCTVRRTNGKVSRPVGGGNRRTWDTKRALGMHKAGKNDREIARELGCAPNSVFYWRVQNNLPANAPGRKQKSK